MVSHDWALLTIAALTSRNSPNQDWRCQAAPLLAGLALPDQDLPVRDTPLLACRSKLLHVEPKLALPNLP